jgi:hypothetical protein
MVIRSLCSSRQPSLATVIVLIVASSSGVPQNASAELMHQRKLVTAAHKPPLTHLYVTTPSATVVSYLLDKNGLPATKPDWQLNGGL